MTASHALSQLSYGPNKKSLKTVGEQRVARRSNERQGDVSERASRSFRPAIYISSGARRKMPLPHQQSATRCLRSCDRYREVRVRLCWKSKTPHSVQENTRDKRSRRQ